MSNYEAVKEFTEGASGTPCPTNPQPMNKQQVQFLVRMVLSEIVELCQTVTDSYDEAEHMVYNCLGSDPSKQPEYKNDIDIIADQADAMVDAWYYMLNASCKNGIDLSKVFDEVHKANMNKRDPITNQFIRRADGKVLKPPGWKPANIRNVVLKMFKQNKEQNLTY